MRRILEVLKRGEEVDYGFLGIQFKEPAIEDQRGVHIQGVIPGSPAAAEDAFRSYDERGMPVRVPVDIAITAINDVPIHNWDDLFRNLGTCLAGNRVRIQVRRNGTPVRTAEVTLAKLYVPGKKIASSLGSRPFDRGLRVDHASLLAQQPPRLDQPIPRGVMVAEVQPNTPAARAALKPGEVITHVNQRPVSTPDDYYRAVQGAGDPVELTLHNFTPQSPPSKVILK
jgi:S1-C subfamily serine protease